MHRLALSLALAAVAALAAATAPVAAGSAGTALRGGAVRPPAVAVSGYGDASGYHLLAAVRRAGTVRWREVAVLDPGGRADRSWSGEQCSSSDGRFAAVAVLPISAVEDPAQRGHGAYAYAVDLRSGRARPLSSSVALGYETPGCGIGHAAILRAFRGRRTTLVRADLASGRIDSATVAGEVTSAVPYGRGAVGVHGADVVHLSAGAFAGDGRVAPGTTLAHPGPTAYDVRVGRRGALWFLTSTFGARRARLWRLRGRDLRNMGTGARTAATLLGSGAHLAAAGFVRLPGGIERLPAPAHRARALASDGSFAVGDVAPRGLHVSAHGRRVTRVRPSPGAHVAAIAAPACSVPRLDPRRQVMQPNAAQVDWATQMAERGLLTGALGRPAGYANMGLGAYAANADFPRIPLHHPVGDAWDTVPRSVMEAIEAQESNWDQASFHALPGIAGDPLIADYYGAGDAIDRIDYARADCGYGIAQVTDGMRAGDTSQMSAEQQVKVAVDYEENIAAGLRILERTWNQLYDAGIRANDGDPRYLENWYFAVWAYNTGIQPNAAHGNASGCTPGPACTGPDGTWGLGWANNPANPAYPPNREHYLETTYADAAHPADWPYQERIMGWMASPLLGFDGTPRYDPPSYHGTGVWLDVPPAASFCSPAADRCSGAGLGRAGTCALADDECWLHTPVSWVDCSGDCATSGYDAASASAEPGGIDPHPPTCLVDLVASDWGPPIVVDDLPSPGYNLVSCLNHTWTSEGTFSYRYGTDAAGEPVGAIDTHQLGAGFGGHILFAHTEPIGAGALIDTGTWAPALPSAQRYAIYVHVPSTGAEIADAVYTIDSNGYGGPWSVRVDQGQTHEQDGWLPLGTFALGLGATVSLTNASAMAAGRYDVAYDAVAFVPQGGSPPPHAETPAPTPVPAPPGPAHPPPGPARDPAPRCDPGEDARSWNVFKVTVTCVASLQVFKDHALAPEAKCLVKLGADLLPLTRIGKAEAAVGGFRAAANALARELEHLSLPRRIGVGLEVAGQSYDFYRDPAWSTLRLVAGSRLVLIGVRQTLTERRGSFPKAFRLLKQTQSAGKRLLETLTPAGDVLSCTSAFRAS